MEIKTDIRGGRAFSYLDFRLPQGGQITAEAGAMASMSSNIDLRSKINGGFFQAILLKFLGRESFFINSFSNSSSSEGQLVLTNSTPGEIVGVDLVNEDLYLQPGAYIASTPGISFRLRVAGLSSWLGGEGLFRLKLTGSGKVWYGAYGAVIEKEVDGSYIVDSGHLLSYPKGIKLKIQLSGGLFSSFFGGEGLVLRLEGKGKIKLQTRSLAGLASWLNPKFFG